MALYIQNTKPTVPVQSGIVSQPYEIYKEIQQGKTSIRDNLLSDSMFLSSVNSVEHSFDLPYSERKFVDVNEVWEESNAAKRKFNEVHNKASKDYSMLHSLDKEE